MKNERQAARQERRLRMRWQPPEDVPAERSALQVRILSALAGPQQGQLAALAEITASQMTLYRYGRTIPRRNRMAKLASSVRVRRGRVRSLPPVGEHPRPGRADRRGDDREPPPRPLGAENRRPALGPPDPAKLLAADGGGSRGGRGGGAGEDPGLLDESALVWTDGL